MNTNTIIHYVKKMWFSLICCIYGAIKILVLKPIISAFLLEAIIFALVSFSVAVTQERFIRDVCWKYTEDYAVIVVISIKYISGLLSILLFSFLR